MLTLPPFAPAGWWTSSTLLFFVAIAVAIVVVVLDAKFKLGILRGILRQSSAERFPYSRREYLLSRGEMAFYKALHTASVDRWTVMCKVRMEDLLLVKAGGRERFTARNRIKSRHLDFVLCEPRTLQPLVAIELDDVSHERSARRKRDLFVDGAFASAGLPLVHIKAAAAYSSADLASLLTAAMNQSHASTAR